MKHTSNRTIAMVSIMFNHQALSLHQYPNLIPLTKQRCLDTKATDGSEEPGHASINTVRVSRLHQKVLCKNIISCCSTRSRATERRCTDRLHFHGRYVAPPADTLLCLWRCLWRYNCCRTTIAPLLLIPAEGGESFCRHRTG